MTHGSLFSGIGGFDLAAEWMGWENVFHCEWNEFGQRVLKYYWPKSISYADITKTDFSIHRGTIDILTGGFPCQPYSLAGKRKGKEDERHLWPEMLRAIREIQPSWIVGENVYGIVNWNGGLVFNEVQAEMEAQGYEVQSFILPACGVNAQHKRERVWFIAFNSTGNANGGYPTGEGRRARMEMVGNKLGTPEREKSANHIKSSNNNDAYANSVGQSRPGRPKHSGDQKENGNWKKHRTFNDGGWANEPKICFGDNGVSGELDGITLLDWRKESVKGAGNAIVPQVVLQIFKAIEQYELL